MTEPAHTSLFVLLSTKVSIRVPSDFSSVPIDGPLGPVHMVEFIERGPRFRWLVSATVPKSTPPAGISVRSPFCATLVSPFDWSS